MAQVAELKSQVIELKAEVAALTLELGKQTRTLQNSLLPPSTQHPHARPLSNRGRSKRKRGGQPGHPRHERSLIPAEECQEVVMLKPEQCHRCGTILRGDDECPLRHQVLMLPEIKPIVTEYQRHRLSCPCCRETTCAPLRPGVPIGMSGPKLIAFVTLLMACIRQSKGRTALFVESILKIHRTVDSLLLRGHSTAVNGMCRELYGHREWLWTFLQVQGVEPTNNAAARSLRHAVIWRKLSFGTQSEQGSRFVETMLTTIETCRQQNLSGIDHVTRSIQNHFQKQKPPSLLHRP